MDQEVISLVVDLLITDKHWRSFTIGTHCCTVELTYGYSVNCLLDSLTHWVDKA